ncbi:MAG: nuclease-related domain-containing protein [Nocardioides sp.]
MSDQDLVVNRWKRYGKDRLYATLPDETKVGFWDLLTGEAHPESPEYLPALQTAFEVWKADQEAAGMSVPSPVTEAVPVALGVPESPLAASPVVEPPAPAGTAPAGQISADVPVARPWLDLATNQPGAEAREQAQAARDAAPVKTVLARVLGVHTEERAWRIGADGEEKVATQLAKVARKDPRWRSLHAIPVGDRGSDIDHLLIGPGGVFTVNAKNHPGARIWVGGNTFMVNGHRQPYVRNSRYEAERAAKLLTAACGFPVYVQGLIVTVNAEDVTIKTQPDGVNVTWRNNLVKWLLRHGDIHTTEALDAIYDEARRSTTWQP